MLIPNFKRILFKSFFGMSMAILVPSFGWSQSVTLESHGFFAFGGETQSGYLKSVPFGSSFQQDDKFGLVSYYLGHEILNDIPNQQVIIPEAISIYPNPVVEFATVNIDTEKIQVLDLNGKVLSEYPRIMKGERIDLRKFSDGIYIARLTLPEGNNPVKIVKLNKSSL